MGRFAKDTLWTMGAHGGTFAMGLVTTAVLSRALGPTGAGRYGLVTVFASLIASVASLGLGPASTYFAARHTHPRPNILGSSLLLSAVFGLLGALVGGVLAGLFGDVFVPDVPVEVVLASLVLVPVTLFWLTARFFTLGLGRIRMVNLADVAIVFLQLAGLVLFTVVLGMGELGAVLGLVLGTALALLGLMRPMIAAAGGIRWRPDRGFAVEALRYGIQAHIANVIQFLNYRADVFLVAGYLGAEPLGFYTVAVALAERVRILSQAAGLVLLPRVAAERDEAVRSQFTPRVARSVTLMSLPPMVILMVLARTVVSLLASDAFLPAVEAFVVLLPGVLLLGTASILANDLAGRGKPLVNSILSAVALVVNLLLNVWWIPLWGITGAAWASTASYSLHFVMEVLVYCRVTGNTVIDVVVPRWSDAAYLWHLVRREAGAAGRFGRSR